MKLSLYRNYWNQPIQNKPAAGYPASDIRTIPPYKYYNVIPFIFQANPQNFPLFFIRRTPYIQNRFPGVCEIPFQNAGMVRLDRIKKASLK